MLSRYEMRGSDEMLKKRLQKAKLDLLADQIAGHGRDRLDPDL
jgi:hypothetical protein